MKIYIVDDGIELFITDWDTKLFTPDEITKVSGNMVSFYKRKTNDPLPRQNLNYERVEQRLVENADLFIHGKKKFFEDGDGYYYTDYKEFS